jgi:diphthamide synthase (EF-2-diphthine--ammonia ligase)
MSKSLTQADLEKGLKRLEEAAQAPNARATELFGKAQDGTITSEEREELVKSVSGSSTLGSRVTSALTGNDTIKKSLDVSDYLREQNGAVVSGLEVLASHLEKSDSQDQEFRVALATTMLQMSELVKSQAVRLDTQDTMLKSISERLGIIAQQPARGPKSVAAAAAAAAGGMNKSFGGGSAQEGLSKSQIGDVLTDMIEKGMQLVGGENLVLAATKYEGSNDISGELLKAVQEHVRKSNHKAA